MSPTPYHPQPSDRQPERPPKGARGETANLNLRFELVSDYTQEQKDRFRSNLESLQHTIESFCETLSKSVVPRLSELTASDSISYERLTRCYVDCYRDYSRLKRPFGDNPLCSQPFDNDVQQYCAELLTRIDECLTRLSNVVLADRTTWKVALRDIRDDMMRCLSLDTENVSLKIRVALSSIKTDMSDNPEAP